jgi:hypothetical protein
VSKNADEFLQFGLEFILSDVLERPVLPVFALDYVHADRELQQPRKFADCRECGRQLSCALGFPLNTSGVFLEREELGLIRFRGHFPKGGYDVHNHARGPQEATTASPV